MTSLDSPQTCPRCGCLNIAQYEDELPICPHCGTMLTAPDPASDDGLTQWPTERRSTLANLFYGVVRRGVTTPAAIVEQVALDIHRRLHWVADHDTRQFWCQVLYTLQDDSQGAQAYAAAVLARERLPMAERERQKQERARTFIHQSMQGKPVTEKQLWLLRSLGHRGTPPTDRAEASHLIDTLLRKKGGAA